MNYNTANNPSDFRTEFTSGHFARLAKLHQKAWSFVEREDVTLTQLQRAMAIELRMEKYIYDLTSREERAKKALRPRQPAPKAANSPSPQPIPEPAASTQPPTVKVTPPTTKPSLPQNPAPCFATMYGYTSAICTECTNGSCQHGLK